MFLDGCCEEDKHGTVTNYGEERLMPQFVWETVLFILISGAYIYLIQFIGNTKTVSNFWRYVATLGNWYWYPLRLVLVGICFAIYFLSVIPFLAWIIVLIFGEGGFS